jgi:hypothetical protein
VDDMAAFIRGMAVNIISIFDAKSRRRRNDANFDERKAFRLCVESTQLDSLLDENVWPSEIVISRWLFKGDKDDTNNPSTTNNNLIS